MKYVIQRIGGQERVIMFDEEVSHASVVHPENGEVVAAGFYFVNMATGNVSISPATSESLGIGPRRAEDYILISKATKGLSGLDRSNMDALATLYGVGEEE